MDNGLANDIRCDGAHETHACTQLHRGVARFIAGTVAVEGSVSGAASPKKVKSAELAFKKGGISFPLVLSRCVISFQVAGRCDSAGRGQRTRAKRVQNDKNRYETQPSSVRQQKRLFFFFFVVVVVVVYADGEVHEHVQRKKTGSSVKDGAAITRAAGAEFPSDHAVFGTGSFPFPAQQGFIGRCTGSNPCRESFRLPRKQPHNEVRAPKAVSKAAIWARKPAIRVATSVV